MRLEDEFVVPAAPSEAWNLLTDVPRVIPCMPGAELVEVVDENTFKALMHVKLGPISLQFASEIKRELCDEAERRVRLAVKAREVKGRGGAEATIESSLGEVDGATHVAIVTDLTLQGTVAQYGRGVVPDVASQLTARFAAALAATLTAAQAARESGEMGESRAEPGRPVGGIQLAATALWTSLRRLVLGLVRR